MQKLFLNDVLWIVIELQIVLLYPKGLKELYIILTFICFLLFHKICSQELQKNKNRKEIHVIIYHAYQNLLLEDDLIIPKEELSNKTVQFIEKEENQSTPYKALSSYYSEEIYTIFSQILLMDCTTKIKAKAIAELLQYESFYFKKEESLDWFQYGIYSFFAMESLMITFHFLNRILFQKMIDSNAFKILLYSLPILFFIYFLGIELLKRMHRFDNKNQKLALFILDFFVLLNCKTPFEAIELSINEAEKHHLLELHDLQVGFKNGDLVSILKQVEKIAFPCSSQVALFFTKLIKNNNYHISFWSEKNQIIQAIDNCIDQNTSWYKYQNLFFIILFLFYLCTIIRFIEVY